MIHIFFKYKVDFHSLSGFGNSGLFSIFNHFSLDLCSSVQNESNLKTLRIRNVSENFRPSVNIVLEYITQFLLDIECLERESCLRGSYKWC